MIPSDKYTREQLLAMMREVEQNPSNQMPEGGFYKYTPSARRKLDAIARALTEQVIDAKKAAGTYVFTGGYSGRQTNKR